MSAKAPTNTSADAKGQSGGKDLERSGLTKEDLNKLVEITANEVPTSLKSLLDNSQQLADVADYCEKQYNEANSEVERARAIRESKQYTVHALASVAYSISVLAQHTTEMVDMQTLQLGGLDESISHLSTCVKIHKEKIVRRDIGKMSMLKRNRPTPLVRVMDGADISMCYRYNRMKIENSSLDEIGFGLPKQNAVFDKTRSLKRQPSLPSRKQKMPQPAAAGAKAAWANRKTGARSTIDGGFYKTVSSGPTPVSVPVCPPKIGGLRSSASEPGIKPSQRPPSRLSAMQQSAVDEGEENLNASMDDDSSDTYAECFAPPAPQGAQSIPRKAMSFDEPMAFSPPSTAPPPAPFSPTPNRAAATTPDSTYSRADMVKKQLDRTNSSASQFHADNDLVDEPAPPLPPPPPMSTEEPPPPPPAEAGPNSSSLPEKARPKPSASKPKPRPPTAAKPKGMLRRSSTTSLGLPATLPPSVETAPPSNEMEPPPPAEMGLPPAPEIEPPPPPPLAETEPLPPPADIGPPPPTDLGPPPPMEVDDSSLAGVSSALDDLPPPAPPSEDDMGGLPAPPPGMMDM